MTDQFWSNRKVLITGHTGFKGGWLTLWLQKLGARVFGYSLHPSTERGPYYKASISKYLHGEYIGDIRDRKRVDRVFEQFQPEFVFHLAAQPLVKVSFDEPLDTFDINITGLLNILENVRTKSCTKVLVNVTSDKCYNNVNDEAFTEDSSLGGDDPYSASKACSEIISNAYKLSFFNCRQIGIATARAGNVIGGGDFTKSRLLPDCFRAVENNLPLKIRNPHAVRPWQHVFEPLNGYLTLAERLYEDPARYSGAWNFGPVIDGSVTVEKLVELFRLRFPNLNTIVSDGSFGEKYALSIDSSKSVKYLKWRPKWTIERAIEKTIEWNLHSSLRKCSRDFSFEKIEEYYAHEINKNA